MRKLSTTLENLLQKVCYQNESGSDADEDSLEAVHTSRVCDHDVTNLP